MIPKIYVSLIVEEEILNDDVINYFSKLKGGKIWAKGQKKNNSNRFYEENGCGIIAQPIEVWDIEDAISYFWNDTNLKENGFLEIIKRNKLNPVLTLAIYVTHSTPSIHLDNYLMIKFIQHNIELEIDIILTE